MEGVEIILRKEGKKQKKKSSQLRHVFLYFLSDTPNGRENGLVDV